MGAAWVLWPIAGCIVKRTEGAVVLVARREREPVCQLPYPSHGPSFRVSFQALRTFEPSNQLLAMK